MDWIRHALRRVCPHWDVVVRASYQRQDLPTFARGGQEIDAAAEQWLDYKRCRVCGRVMVDRGTHLDVADRLQQ